MPVRTVVETGPAGKRAVAFALDWPGRDRAGVVEHSNALALMRAVGLKV